MAYSVAFLAASTSIADIALAVLALTIAALAGVRARFAS